MKRKGLILIGAVIAVTASMLITVSARRGDVYVSGRIVNPNGVGMNGVKVYVMKWTITLASGKTDITGKYQIFFRPCRPVRVEYECGNVCWTPPVQALDGTNNSPNLNMVCSLDSKAAMNNARTSALLTTYTLYPEAAEYVKTQLAAMSADARSTPSAQMLVAQLNNQAAGVWRVSGSDVYFTPASESARLQLTRFAGGTLQAGHGELALEMRPNLPFNDLDHAAIMGHG